jgi:uncharacterized membrane protein YdbT with pleckstrin-like domain
MAYYTKVLLPDEQVRMVAHLHWAIFLKSWACLIIGAGAAVLAGMLYQDHTGDTPEQLYPAGIAGATAIIFVGLGVIFLIAAFIRRAATEIVVTDRRVIFKTGIVQRHTMEMNMNKVETVDVVQSILGRVFNYGTVLIRGVGSSYEPLNLIADPLGLRTAIVAE